MSQSKKFLTGAIVLVSLQIAAHEASAARGTLAVMTVTPATGISQSLPQGGPFNPVSVNYTLTNTSGVPINYTATTGLVGATNSLVFVLPSSGSIAAGGTANVSVSVTGLAITLTPGTYTDTLTFTDTTNATSETRPISVTVTAAAVAGPLNVTPAGGVSQTLTQGAAFVPASQTYTLTNNGSAPLDWTITKTQAWVLLSSASGTLAAGASTTVQVSIDPTANALAPASYNDTVTFTNTTSNSGNQTRPVSLTVSAPATGATLAVSTPGFSWFFVGHPGGPFSPASLTYTLTNTGSASLNFAVTNDQTWASATPPSGSLAAGATTTVAISPNATANALPAGGDRQNLVTFTNTTNGVGTTTLPNWLLISPPGTEMTVTATTNVTASGATGGPFTPATSYYQVRNVSAQPIVFSVTNTQPWLTIAPSFPSISLGVGVSTSMQLTINASAASLAPGTYTDTVTFTNTTTGVGNTTRTVTLTVGPVTTDTTPPTISISSPAPPTAPVASSPATVSGTATDNVGVSQVDWANARTGGSGTATGTTAWNASIPLASGSNLITITARDAAGNAASTTITLDLSAGGGDTTPPVVTITTPTAAATDTVSSSPYSLGGSATDNVSVSSVTWSNALTGTSGSAVGLGSWSALVPLATGVNPITVTAFDSSGNSSSDTITVTLAASVPGPSAGSGGGKSHHCLGAVATEVPAPFWPLLLAALLLGISVRRQAT